MSLRHDGVYWTCPYEELTKLWQFFLNQVLRLNSILKEIFMKLILMALLLTSFSANAGIFKSLSKKMEGFWSYSHTVMMVDHDGESEDGWIEADVMDEMIIEADGRDKINFEFTTWHTNGHSCGLEGVAVKEGSKFIYKGQEDWGGSLCTLEISLSKEKGIILKDENSACARNNCGMRGYLDGATFPNN